MNLYMIRNGIEESLSVESAASRISRAGDKVEIAYLAHAGFDFPDDNGLVELMRQSSVSFAVKPVVVDERVWNGSPFYPAHAYGVISCTQKAFSVAVRDELYHFASQLRLDYNSILEAYEALFSGIEVFSRAILLNQVKTLIDRVKDFRPSSLGEFLAYSHYFLLLKEVQALQNVKVAEVKFGKYSEILEGVNSDVFYLSSPLFVDYVSRDFPDRYVVVNPSRETLFRIDDLGNNAIIIGSKLLRLIR